MTARRHLGAVAAVATLLAATPMAAIYAGWTWLVQCVVAVVAIAAAAAAARSLRAPLWAQLVAMAGALTVALTWLFPSGEEIIGIVPSPGTFQHFGALLVQAPADMRDFGIPVPDQDPLLFLTTLGIGLVAILIDVCVVTLRRPALAGLPMLAVYSVPVAIRFDNMPVLPFVIGALGFLWLLMSDNIDRVRRFGRRFTGDGRDVDAWEPSPLAGAGRRLAVVGIAAAVVLPLLVPMPSNRILDQFGGGFGGVGGSGRGGGPGAVNLIAELSGQLNQDSIYPMAEVTTDEARPYYLRFGVADQIIESGFANAAPSGRPVGNLPTPSARSGVGVTQTVHRATVRLTDDFIMPMVPTYPELIRVDGLGNSWLYDRNAQIVFSARSLSAGRSYEFEYVRTELSPAALRTAAPLPSDHDIQQQFAEVPEIQVVRDLVVELTAEAATQYDQVMAIHRYFSRANGFFYSRQTEPGTSGSAVVDFLENKRGFCVQYAAAMAWMVRTAGLPARVAIGFTRGSERTDGTYVLTNRNLHAWTEVYFDGFGWVPFDATPPVPGTVDTLWAPNPHTPADGSPDSPSPGPDGSQPDRPDGSPDNEDPDLDGGAPPGVGGPLGPPSSSWPWWVAGLVLVLSVMSIPALARVRLRRHRLPRRFRGRTRATALATATGPAPHAPFVTAVDDAANARYRAHAAWDELLDTMVDFRLPLDPTETPRATVDRLTSQAALTGPGRDGVRLLGQAEERASYAVVPLSADGLVPALARARQALAAQATRGVRARAILLPPSTVLRWRQAVSETTTRAVAAMSRWRVTVARLSPRRVLQHRT